MSSVGNGPLCPAVPAHGRMYSRDRAGDPSKGYRCMDSDHGGNGRAFTEQEANGGYELEENDVALIYEVAARDVISNKKTIDQVVQSVAQVTKRPSAQVREAILIMIDTLQEKSTAMAEKKKTAATKKATPTVKGERRRLEHVDGAEFARVRDELGLTNKQAAEATGEAGMGASATYIYIVTHQGSSVKLFEKYQAALRAYAKKNKVRRPKAPVEAAPAAEAPSEEAASGDDAVAEVEVEEQIPVAQEA